MLWMTGLWRTTFVFHFSCVYKLGKIVSGGGVCLSDCYLPITHFVGFSLLPFDSIDSRSTDPMWRLELTHIFANGETTLPLGPDPCYWRFKYSFACSQYKFHWSLNSLSVVLYIRIIKYYSPCDLKTKEEFVPCLQAFELRAKTLEWFCNKVYFHVK